MKGYDYRRIIDNQALDTLVQEGFFEELFGEEVRLSEQRAMGDAFR